MLDGYNTVANPETVEQTIDKSRFIALVAQVSTTAEVQQHMQETQRAFPNARHYVYAYRLNEGRREKASDDGEPQGTGGRPLLDLLQYRKIWDVQIIVVRYFGGILLGTGGLTRAYGGTARLALEKAGIATLSPHFLYTLQVPYSWYEQVKYGIAQEEGWRIDKEEFLETISLDMFIPEEDSQRFEKWINELTHGQIECKKIKAVLKPL